MENQADHEKICGTCRWFLKHTSWELTQDGLLQNTGACTVPLPPALEGAFDDCATYAEYVCRLWESQA